MKAYYDHRTPWHDDYLSFQGYEHMEEVHQSIIELIEPFILNKSVLELACGTGNWTGVLAKRAKDVTAIDSSRKSIARAKEKLNSFDNVTFKCMDVYSLNELNQRINVIFAADWFSHVPKAKIDSFLVSLNNISQTGTPIIFIDMTNKKEFEEEESYFDIDENRVSKRELPDGSSFEVIKNFFSKKEILGIISKYGTDVRYNEFDLVKRWMVEYKAN